MINQEIADIFSQIADMLELKGENVFKINAFRKAIRVLKDLQKDLDEIRNDGGLSKLPGIGDAFVKKIEEYLDNGQIKKYEELKKEIPAGLLELLNIQHLGPKTLALIHRELSVNNLADLAKVIDNGQMAKLPGLGEKKTANIASSLKFYTSAQDRMPLGTAMPIAEEIIAYLREKADIQNISFAGSLRRMKETAGDIDILVSTEANKKITETFVSMPMIKDVIAKGTTKTSVRLKSNIQVDLRVVDDVVFGSALQYFTGSQAHNVKLRGLAKKKSLKINEYGIFKNDKKIGGQSEEDIYQQLGLSFVPPEMREDRGEVESAAEGTLPQLVEFGDIRGELHVHSNYSDGHSTIKEMAEKAQKMGYSYLAICDHSKSANYANGLSVERLKQQMDEIDELNQQFNNFIILKGTEVDILSDGGLDYPDDVLEKLDIVVASIHSGFKQNPTQRLLKAMDNPYVDFIGHPSGRLINVRKAYEVDLDALFEKADNKNIAIEMNSHPSRLDLNDMNAKKAADMGVKLVINTDAHSTENLDYIKYGIGTARRAWLTKENLLNCLSYQHILEWKKKRIENFEND